MKKPELTPPIARGPGPRWFRWGLVALAVVYYGALLHHPPEFVTRWLRPAVFFTEATALFPFSNKVVLEYRIEVWGCGQGWKPIDPRPYFPIEPENKESRFQRLGFFYFNSKRPPSPRERAVAKALDAYISRRHATGADDGVTGPIGGIRVMKATRPFPEPGEPVQRYHYDPFATAPGDELKEKYATPADERERRCASS
ncbi:MAG TPA: hypothetical protein VHW23_11940 [Kofleriaceae bacterium]|nr:hypothetical protein [Kofleriaceae bacterium]